MKKENYFADIQGIGSLDILYVFYEDAHPILFLCKDKAGREYLCQCYEYRKVQRWHLAEISQICLDDMLWGKVSVREAFQRAEHIFDIEYTLLKEEKCRKVSYDDIDAVDLPDEDFFLDEDDRQEYLDFFGMDTNEKSFLFINEAERLFRIPKRNMELVQVVSNIQFKEEIPDGSYRIESAALKLGNIVIEDGANSMNCSAA